MRPLRLELHGFTAFREEVTVDFDGADLFALAGPTGAGKSSIIDGICFALYGSVPRLDRRTVAPIIATGKVEARIRLDFAVGPRTYTAVRVVRRTGTGATTKEARLEHDGAALAGDADGMTAAVERLLGLGFEQFTKSVVLPQGEFARFLHDKPSGRQELLVKLLELGVYERMRADANARKAAANAAAELTHGQLEALAGATPQALAYAAAAVERLTRLRDEIDHAQPRIDELTAARDAAARRCADAQADVALLATVAVPDGVEALAQAVTAAEQQVADATAAVAAAEQATAAAEAARADAGDPGVLTELRRLHAEHATLSERIAKGEPIVAQRRAAEAEATQRLADAAERLQAAGDALASARRDHAAHALAATLAAGDDCPVCLQPVERLPDRPAPAALAAAEAAHTQATREHTGAQQALAPVRDERLKAEQHLEHLREQLEQVTAALASAPPPQEVDRQLAGVAAADKALDDTRARERDVRRRLQQAHDAAAAARTRRDTAWTAFTAARDAVAALRPPPAERDDLVAAWTALAAWADQQTLERTDVAKAAEAEAARAAGDVAELTAGITARCEECAVVVARGARPRDSVADALARAEAHHRRVGADIERAEALRGDLQRHREAAGIAKELGRHLSAKGFEQWLLDEALGSLAAGASDVLRELSGGQYSLTLDGQRNFVVVDHRSADEQRPARTLSGGETFLASLSLALTLGDHLGQLAVGSQPRLESIFLDEGFGTLDPETLDVVAAAIEELGARGRMVGLVTHVRELAERMPVRFEVRKAPGGSTVERVER